MSIQVQATRVFKQNLAALTTHNRYIVNEGGSRSSKTYSLCQLFIYLCLTRARTTVSVVRRTGPALSRSVLRDMKEVISDMSLDSIIEHRKGEGKFLFPNGSWIEMFSCDQEQKLRGSKRQWLWINEANEVPHESFKQLAMRTEMQIFVDYNPSALSSYLYELPDEKTLRIHSTFKDNPFLEPAIVEEIQAFQQTDPDYYTIFALGQRAQPRETVYRKWETRQRPANLTEYIYAIDFGYTHPTAMVKIWYEPGNPQVHLEEMIYESYLTANDILQRFSDLGISTERTIVAETARPEMNAQIAAHGYRIVKADKAVQDGIANVKTFQISVEPTSSGIIKENFEYRYAKRGESILETPIKINDDLMDAIRYGLMYIKKYCMTRPEAPTSAFSFEFTPEW